MTKIIALGLIALSLVTGSLLAASTIADAGTVRCWYLGNTMYCN